jgi:hypothetical protein
LLTTLEVLRGVFVLFFFAVPRHVAKVTKSALLPWVNKLGGVFWLDIKRANIDFLRRTMIEIVACAGKALTIEKCPQQSSSKCQWDCKTPSV